MTDWFGAVSGFAQEIEICTPGGVRRCRAFIQPLSVTAPERAGLPTPAGVSDGRRYLIIAGPEAFDGRPGATVRCGERCFEVLRCERMGAGTHWEGVMRLKAGECGA